MKIITFVRADGGVSIVHPAPNSRREDEKEEDWLRRVAEKSVPPETNYEITEKETLPQDRRWRNAWKRTPEGIIDVDLKEARKVRKQEVELERDTMIAALRDQLIEATGAEATALRKKIKDLRALDLKAEFDKITTLKNLEKAEPHKGV